MWWLSYFNPRSPHGERRCVSGNSRPNRSISIHALLTESDRSGHGPDDVVCRISIHALLTESDVGLHASAPPDKIFQSTLSSRRATKSSAELAETKRFQSTLSSRRATDGDLVITLSAGISIHALLTESDRRWYRTIFPREKFQSTLSSRRATLRGAVRKSLYQYFNPRSPHGERPKGSAELAETKRFQSTLSSRRATSSSFFPSAQAIFQSTLSSRRATANTTKLALSFLSKVPILGWEKSKKAKGSANARGSFPVYGKNKVRIPWGDFECFRFAPIK